MESVLIVSDTSSTLLIVSQMLQAQIFNKITSVANGAKGRRQILEEDYDLIIIDSPLNDEFGDDFALHAAENTDSAVIQIVSNDKIDEINSDCEDAGVFLLPKPISPDFFYRAVKLLTASRLRVQKLQSENHRLQDKIEEIRTVNRAKLVLIQVLKMTEEQAHRYIEKQSMDLRRPKISVAQNILKMYDR